MKERTTIVTRNINSIGLDVYAQDEKEEVWRVVINYGYGVSWESPALGHDAARTFYYVLQSMARRYSEGQYGEFLEPESALERVMENPLYKDATLEGNEIKRRIGDRMMGLEQYEKWEGEKEND
jgi:hypothetical protein